MAECPASMCPLIAPNGSPWTGEYAGTCPAHADADAGGCPWWGLGCAEGGPFDQVVEAQAAGGMAFVAGPNKPRRLTAAPREYDCPRAAVCQWQIRATLAGNPLCPPREALARGLDPRVTLF